ncbi:MAG: double-strand break repair protein AddB [Alphaproteobacteria bacterium]|nr:double-strand break repair protein AddB [Alphaproteobacteria bacterium]
MNKTSHCVTIPVGRPFLQDLVALLHQRYGDDPIRLSSVLVLLPNERSCRALKEAFLTMAQTGACLLPSIRSLAEATDDEDDAWVLSNLKDIAPAIPVSMPRRHVLLMQLIRAAEPMLPPAQLSDMAHELAFFLDEATRHQLSMDHLQQLVPDYLATHWQQTLNFLKIITHHWPALLQAQAMVDPVCHRRDGLLKLAALWQAQPPPYPVVAAGSTGSQPATAALLKTIASLPEGLLVLPGLDKQMPTEPWQQLTQTHPQYGLKQLLDVVQISRDDVLEVASGSNRAPWLQAIFADAEQTARWKEQPLPNNDAMAAIAVLEAETQAQEAAMIAMALREAVATPNQTAALVTPDRTLAAMVAVQLHRFGIVIDDSAGTPLMDTPAGVLLRLVAKWLSEPDSGSSLLAILRHPLVAMGSSYCECRNAAAKLELGYLRGLVHYVSLEALTQACAQEAFAPLIQQLTVRSQALRSLFSADCCNISQLFAELINFCEWLATVEESNGETLLWLHDTGRQLAAALAEWQPELIHLAEFNAQDMADLMESLLAGKVYRPRYGQHPRLCILSPMEARLLTFDRVILGGLNEGMWPSAHSISPWMSRPMRQQFGLPAEERKVGQSAHDVWQLLASREVLLTRSRKNGGKAQIPSRWLVRLKTYIHGHDPALWERMDRTHHYHAMLNALQQPLKIATLERPQPVPPAELKPQMLSPTMIETLSLNPYAVYASKILHLKPLDALGEVPSAKHFGQLLHRALELFVSQFPTALPQHPEHTLRDCMRQTLAPILHWPVVRALWWPRFESLVPWLIIAEKESRALAKTILAEQPLVWPLKLGANQLTIRGTLDRLDVRRDGSLAIIDYKTGTPPTAGEIEHATINQLALYALCLCRSEQLVWRQLSGKPDEKRLELYYWKLGNHPDQCERIQVGVALHVAEQRLRELLTSYLQPDYAFVCSGSDESHSFNPYHHLARYEEWEGL